MPVNLLAPANTRQAADLTAKELRETHGPPQLLRISVLSPVQDQSDPFQSVPKLLSDAGGFLRHIIAILPQMTADHTAGDQRADDCRSNSEPHVLLLLSAAGRDLR